MEYLAIALAVILAAGGLAAAVAFPTLAHERDIAQAKVAELQKQLSGSMGDVARVQVAAANAARDYERVISDFKSDVLKLEGELDACSDPAVVRARLRSLFPEAGPPAGGDAGGPGLPA